MPKGAEQVANRWVDYLQQGLNIGGGGGSTQEIKIRLRPAKDKSSFRPFNRVLGVLLHELCHNHIGPHNDAFYKLLNELWTVRCHMGPKTPSCITRGVCELHHKRVACRSLWQSMTHLAGE